MLSIIRQRIRKHTLLNTVKLKKKVFPGASRTEFYFGYGANLSMARFTGRKMNVEEIGNSYLDDYEIRFTLSNEYKSKGYAGVHPHSKGRVYGVLYKMDRISLALLDTLEWCGLGAYERRQVEVKSTVDGKIYTCWCYFVKNPKNGLFPSSVYLGNMIKAAAERNFPKDYIKFLDQTKVKKSFQLNHGYSLFFYGERRVFEEKLQPIYRLHDKLREKLCTLI